MGREISCSCLRADVSQNSKSVGVVSSKGRRRAARRNEKSPKNKDRIDREEEWMGRETTKNMCRKMKKNILSRSRSLALSLSLSGVLVQSAQPRAGSLRLFIHPALFVPHPIPLGHTCHIWVTITITLRCVLHEATNPLQLHEVNLLCSALLFHFRTHTTNPHWHRIGTLNLSLLSVLRYMKFFYLRFTR